MSTPLRLAAALLVPLLFLAACGDDEPDESDSSSEPSSQLSSEPTDDATTEATEATEATESASLEPTDDATDPSPVAESATPTEGDDCTLLPTAAVTAAFGEEMSLIGAGAETCIFNAASGSEYGATVNLTELQIDQDEYADGTREGCEGRIRKVRTGDEAFTCVGPIGPHGYLFEDGYSVVLDVVATNEAAALELAAQLLPSVLVP
jgi:hypothetical protein